MSEGSFLTGLHSGGLGLGNWNPWSNAPLNGPDGQPMLAMVGDLGDTLVSGSGGISNTGTTGTSPAPVSGSGAGLVINITWDASVNSAPTGFVSAVDYVVNYYESLFSTPTTVNIDVGYGEVANQALPSNALGESETFLAAYSYNAIKSALATSDPSAAASLAVSQPVSGTMWTPTSEAKALGLTPAQPTGDIDGYAGFSSALPFTYDSNNRAVAGAYDFFGVVEHEFSEIMGRIDLFGTSIGNTAGYSPFDLFHYTSQGVHTYTGATTNYFSADGGHTNLDYFNANPSGDLGDWAASAGADSYLAFSPSGQADLVTPSDITAMNALGYESTPPTVIETFGLTELVLSGTTYYLEPVGGGAGPSLKYGGAAVVAGNIGGWSPIGVEAITGGYEVAWKEDGQNAYSIWNTDSNGNFTTLQNGIGGVAGTNIAFEAAETSFRQDLNNDGRVGIPPTVIESFGSTELDLSGTTYYLDPLHTAAGTGPSLKYGGAPVVAGNIGGWSPIGVEASAGGYEVAWKEDNQNAYSIWNTDANGNFTSIQNGIGGVPGTNAAFEAAETSFQQDLNGDHTIGVPGGGGSGSSTVIEAFGSTALDLSGTTFYLDQVGGSAGTGPTLKYGGTAIVAGASIWAPIGAEAISGGYEVAWKLTGQDHYIVWNLDTNGNFATANPIGQVTGSSSALESLEPSFHQDLNGDGTIGVPGVTTIEAFGTLALVSNGVNYFLDPVSGGTGPTLKYGGTAIVVGASAWTPIGADAYTPQAYEVAFKLNGQDSYIVWIVDHSGNFIVANPIGQVAGSNVGLESLELGFQQDLNGDGTIGVPGSHALPANTVSDHNSELPTIGVNSLPAHHDVS